MPYINPSCWKKTMSQDKRDVKGPERGSKQLAIKEDNARRKSTAPDQQIKEGHHKHKTDSGAIIEKQIIAI